MIEETNEQIEKKALFFPGEKVITQVKVGIIQNMYLNGDQIEYIIKVDDGMIYMKEQSLLDIELKNG